MTRAHTPGPWKAHNARLVDSRIYKANVHMEKPENGLMPAAGYGHTPEQAEANARLIAAAPVLLEALELIVDVWKHHGIVTDEHERIVKSAIAQATK